MSDTNTRNQTWFVKVAFDCMMEFIAVKDLQSAGRFASSEVSPMGDVVFLTLMDRSTNTQILRVQGANATKADDLMSAAIRAHFYSLHRSSLMQGIDYVMLQSLKDDIARLSGYLVSNYPGRVGDHEPVVSAAIRLLGEESKSVGWWGRAAAWMAKREASSRRKQAIQGRADEGED